MSRIPASLQVLLSQLIDYAGLYPPANLPLDRVLENYRHYLLSPESWILNRLVLPAGKLPEVHLGEDWRISLRTAAPAGGIPGNEIAGKTFSSHLLRSAHSGDLRLLCQAAYWRHNAGSDSQ